MPDFTDTYDADQNLVLGDNNFAWGTIAFGDTYGVVKSASCAREADLATLAAAGGNLLAAVMSNMRFVLTMESIFPLDVDAPGLMAIVAIPHAGVNGRVLKSTVNWERGAERSLTLEVTSWDALEAATAYMLEGTTFTSVDPAP